MYELRINNILIDDAKSFYVKQQCYITISLNIGATVHLSTGVIMI